MKRVLIEGPFDEKIQAEIKAWIQIQSLYLKKEMKSA